MGTGRLRLVSPGANPEHVLSRMLSGHESDFHQATGLARCHTFWVLARNTLYNPTAKARRRHGPLALHPMSHGSEVMESRTRCHGPGTAGCQQPQARWEQPPTQHGRKEVFPLPEGCPLIFFFFLLISNIFMSLLLFFPISFLVGVTSLFFNNFCGFAFNSLSSGSLSGFFSGVKAAPRWLFCCGWSSCPEKARGSAAELQAGVPRSACFSCCQLSFCLVRLCHTSYSLPQPRVIN